MPVARCQPIPTARLALSSDSDPDADARRKPKEPASLPTANASLVGVDAVDRDHASNGLGTPERRLGPANDLDPGREVGVQQLEAGLKLPVAGSLARMPSMNSKV